MLTRGSTLEKAINHGEGRWLLSAHLQPWERAFEQSAGLWQNAWELFPLHHYWGQHKGYLGCSRKCIVENNSTLMTDPGIYLGKAEAVALAHLICAVNGRQLSACFCYTCSCLQKFLRIFFFVNKTIYPFTWQSCQCHNLNYHSDFPDGIFFSPKSASEEFAQVEGSHWAWYWKASLCYKKIKDRMQHVQAWGGNKTATWFLVACFAFTPGMCQ